MALSQSALSELAEVCRPAPSSHSLIALNPGRVEQTGLGAPITDCTARK
jgi:hypothetical protein